MGKSRRDEQDVTGAHGISNGGVALFIVIGLALTGLLWLSEKDSCTRQGARTAIRITAAAAYNARMDDADKALREGDRMDAARFRGIAAQYALAWREAQPLDCGGLFPDTRHQGPVPAHPPRHRQPEAKWFGHPSHG